MEIECYSGCSEEELDKMFDDQICNTHDYIDDVNKSLENYEIFIFN